MPPLRPLLLFFATLFVVYGALTAPWPGVRDAYASVYRSFGNALYDGFGPGGRVRFRPAPAGSKMDTIIALRSRRNPNEGTTPHNSRITGYLPTMLVLSLILATPLAWPRKWKALLWGLAGVHLFIYIRVTVLLFYFFSAEGPWAIYQFGPFRRGLVDILFENLVISPTLTFIVPVFIWIVATFRMADLAPFLTPAEATATEPGGD